MLPSEKGPSEDDCAPADSLGCKADETSIHVDRARSGDPESLAWVVQRVTPLLLAQARFRLQRILGQHYEPEDLVQDVWLRAIPKLHLLQARDGRLTPVLVRFLSSILLNRYRSLLDKHIGNKPLRDELRQDELPAEQESVVQAAMRAELHGVVHSCMEELPHADKEIIVLRVIEQAPLREVAALLKITPNHAAVRCHRALKRLRDRLPDSVFHELSG